ncbi:MAG: adenosine deaminase [Chlorobi bacterium CHB1]|nr:adenosine deaminase [Chlorobi bacterium CHB1]
MTITRDFLHALPKTDLHCHLDGSIRVKTAMELAKANGLALPSNNENEVYDFLSVKGQVENLNEYIDKFDFTLKLMQDYESLRRIAYELAEDAAAENLRYIEVRYSPILHQQKGLSLEQVVDAVLEGLGEAEKKFPIRTAVIICAIRSMTPEATLRLAELTLQYKGKGVVAFDLAGREFGNPAKDHAKAFYFIRKHCINCTVHAGEAYGPDSIYQAIHACGAHRIGHGTRLIEDEELLHYVCDHRIPLEVCLISNVQTKAVLRIEHHPFKKFLDRQLRVTLNTDNRLISRTTMTDELWLAVQTWDLNYEQVKKIILNGFKSLFIPFAEKTKIYHEAKAELTKYD